MKENPKILDSANLYPSIYVYRRMKIAMHKKLHKYHKLYACHSSSNTLFIRPIPK